MAVQNNGDNGVQLARDSQFLIDSFLPPTVSQPSKLYRLPLPLCLPQIATGSPFARGYNPILHQAVDLPMEEFIAFLDGLNLAIVASPSLRVVSLAGKVLGLIPHHWAMIASTAIDVGAQAGMRILSKTLTDRYLRAANLRVFRPRGLAARICTTDAMMLLLGMDPNASTSSLSTLVSPQPVSRTSTSRGVTQVKVDYTMAGIQRRLSMLGNAALPVSFDVPPPAKSKGAMDTMQAWGVKFDEMAAARQERKRIRQQEKRARKLDKRAGKQERREEKDASKYERKAEKQMEKKEKRAEKHDKKAEKHPEKADKRAEKDQRKADKRERKDEKHVLKDERRAEKWEDKEERRTEKRAEKEEKRERRARNAVLWLVIVDAARDREIMGISEADNERDVEVVTEQAWRQEVDHELSEDEELEYADEKAVPGAYGAHKFP
ncbi:hypothetical protein K523DRAFT_291399 [Schizophyllum commune Tattone D]|nr:hypothetical protein K523DRAFT_291399 [Schizophyllum commune Tattone D]